MEPVKKIGLDPQIATKLAMKLHAHLVQNAYEFVSTARALERACVTSHCHKVRNWVLLVILLIPIDLFCFCFAGGGGTRRLGSR